MRNRFLPVMLVAVVVAACGGDGVSQAEYEQKVAELALAQQDLVAERNVVAALQSELEGIDPEALLNEIAVLEGEVAVRDDLARTLIEESGAVLDEERSPLEQLAELLIGTEPMEDVNTSVRLDAYLATISLVAGLGTDPPPDRVLLEDVRPTVDATLDMELTTRFDELIAAAQDDPANYESGALRFIQDAADFAAQVNAGERPPG